MVKRQESPAIREARTGSEGVAEPVASAPRVHAVVSPQPRRNSVRKNSATLPGGCGPAHAAPNISGNECVPAAVQDAIGEMSGVPAHGGCGFRHAVRHRRKDCNLIVEVMAGSSRIARSAAFCGIPAELVRIFYVLKNPCRTHALFACVEELVHKSCI